MKDLSTQCGQRLLPVYIDEVAQTNPSRPFVSVAKTSNALDGYFDVTLEPSPEQSITVHGNSSVSLDGVKALL